MSKKRADHTLSDLLSLKMAWFRKKNAAMSDSDFDELIDYIKKMVRLNVFKGAMKLSAVFKDYTLPTDINDINKQYFEAFNNYVEEPSKFDIPKLPDDQIATLAVISKDHFQRRLNGVKNDITYFSNAIAEAHAKVAKLLKDISDYNQSLITLNADVLTYEAKLAEPDQVDTELLEQLKTDGEFTLALVEPDGGGKALYFVSKRPITCAYYGSNVRKECEFGHAVVKFHLSGSSELIFSRVYFSHLILATNTYWHPHVNNSGSLCSGDASHVITNPEIPLQKRLNAIYAVLTTYNAANPYIAIEVYINKRKTSGTYLYDKLPQPILEIFETHEDLVKRIANGALYNAYNGNRMTYTSNLLESRKKDDLSLRLRYAAEAWDNGAVNTLISYIESNSTDIPLDVVFNAVRAFTWVNAGYDGYRKTSINSMRLMYAFAVCSREFGMKFHVLNRFNGSPSGSSDAINDGYRYWGEFKAGNGSLVSLADCDGTDDEIVKWAVHRPNYLFYSPIQLENEDEAIEELAVKVQEFLHTMIQERLEAEKAAEVTTYQSSDIPF